MQSTPWYKQVGFYLSLVAIALAGYAVMREQRAFKLAEREDFRQAIIGLQESMAAGPGNSAADRSSRVKAWIYFDTAHRLEPSLAKEISLVDYLILANFAYSHSDLDAADGYIDKALTKIEHRHDSTECCLARMGIAHLQFKHYPRTKLEKGREYYQTALEEARKLGQGQDVFVELSILQEAALDEYSTGHAAEGDALAKQADELLKSQSLPERFVSDWHTAFEHAAIEAKVQGKLL